MIKKTIIFLPLLLTTLIFLTVIYYSENLPKEPDIYIFALLNILATLLIRNNKAISMGCGIIFGLMSGVYMWIISLSNWKLDIELYIGVLFIILYLFIGIYFLYSHYKMR